MMAPRFAYTVLAAYRFLPELQWEYESIRLARRMRSGRRPSGPAAWLAEQRAVLMPFIAGAIRRTDRVAVAMDSRGFAGRRPRTHYRTLRIGRGDIAMLFATLALALGIVTLSALAGSLRLWTGVLRG